MTFISLCTALYDYHPQSEGELAIQEGELIYVLEKSTEDDWWKAKKRAVGEEEEEPTGLIPNNYVQEVSRCCVRAVPVGGRAVRGLNKRSLAGVVNIWI